MRVMLRPSTRLGATAPFTLSRLQLSMPQPWKIPVAPPKAADILPGFCPLTPAIRESKTRPRPPLLPYLPSLRMSSQLLSVNAGIVSFRFSIASKTRSDEGAFEGGSLRPPPASCRRCSCLIHGAEDGSGGLCINGCLVAAQLYNPHGDISKAHGNRAGVHRSEGAVKAAGVGS